MNYEEEIERLISLKRWDLQHRDDYLTKKEDERKEERRKRNNDRLPQTSIPPMNSSAGQMDEYNRQLMLNDIKKQHEEQAELQFEREARKKDEEDFNSKIKEIDDRINVLKNEASRANEENRRNIDNQRNKEREEAQFRQQEIQRLKDKEEQKAKDVESEKQRQKENEERRKQTLELKTLKTELSAIKNITEEEKKSELYLKNLKNKIFEAKLKIDHITKSSGNVEQKFFDIMTLKNEIDSFKVNDLDDFKDKEYLQNIKNDLRDNLCAIFTNMKLHIDNIVKSSSNVVQKFFDIMTLKGKIDNYNVDDLEDCKEKECFQSFKNGFSENLCNIFTNMKNDGNLKDIVELFKYDNQIKNIDATLQKTKDASNEAMITLKTVSSKLSSLIKIDLSKEQYVDNKLKEEFPDYCDGIKKRDAQKVEFLEVRQKGVASKISDFYGFKLFYIITFSILIMSIWGLFSLFSYFKNFFIEAIIFCILALLILGLIALFFGFIADAKLYIRIGKDFFRPLAILKNELREVEDEISKLTTGQSLDSLRKDFDEYANRFMRTKIEDEYDKLVQEKIFLSKKMEITTEDIRILNLEISTIEKSKSDAEINITGIYNRNPAYAIVRQILEGVSDNKDRFIEQFNSIRSMVANRTGDSEYSDYQIRADVQSDVKWEELNTLKKKSNYGIKNRFRMQREPYV